MAGKVALTNPRTLLTLFKEAYQEWSEDKASNLAAALAYYTAFSVAPLLLLAITVAGLIFGREAAQGQVFGQLQGLLGPEGASAIQTGIANSQKGSASLLSAIIGFATLIWSASNVFAQLQDALDTIWEVRPDPNAGIVGTVKRRFLSMTMVLGIGFLLLVSLVLSAGLTAVGTFFGNLLPGGTVVWEGVNFVLSFGVITALFAAMYKILPDAKVAWSDVWFGAAATALLFTIGKFLLGLYLGYASIGSTFGAAGSLLVFLVWVYYSAQILLFGAEMTQVYARMNGSRIQPSEGAVPLTEEARAEQGAAHEETELAAAADSRGRQPVAAMAATNGTGSDQHNGAIHANGSAAYTNGTGRTNGNGHLNGVSHASMNGHTDEGNGTSKRKRGSGGTSGAPDALKKVMWAGLVSGSMALGTIAARRASAGIWRTVLHEEPPTKDV